MKVNFFQKVWQQGKRFFTQLPVVEAGFQISAGRVGACLVKEKSRLNPLIFLEELPSGCLEPSFHKRNLRQPDVLKDIFKRGLEKIKPERKSLAFLPPELSLKVFVLSFEALPSGEEEREKIILFSIRKQQPLLPQDIRISYQIIPENGKLRVVGLLARQGVVEEYEELFSSLGYQINLISPPTISLFHLVEQPQQGLVMNIEPEWWGGFAYDGQRIVFYRQKTFASNWEKNGNHDWESVLQEIETTTRFIEDKEKLKLKQVIIRNTCPQDSEVLYSKLKEQFGLEVAGIEDYIGANLSQEVKTIFAPLLGILG